MIDGITEYTLSHKRARQGFAGAMDAMRKDDNVLLPSVVGALLVVVHQSTDDEEYPRLRIESDLGFHDYVKVVKKLNDRLDFLPPEDE